MSKAPAPKLHAKLSASGAHRWMACPGSVAAEDGLPDKSSSFAEEGTIAHDVMEKCLKGGWNASTVCDDAEMADAVQVYLDYVRSFPARGKPLIEARVNFSRWVPGGFGTADTILFYDDTMHIVDLKYGKGVRVSAEENPQAQLYALGAYADYGEFFDIKNIKIAIVQPRIDNITEWEISFDDLMKFGEAASQAAETAFTPNAPRVPGEKQCRFCKAKATCPALFKLTTDVILSDFDDISGAPAPNNLTTEQMSKVLTAKPLIEAWLEAVEKFATEKIASGGGFPGFKLVEGRSIRKWIDEDVAAERLQCLIGERATWTRKLISPSQAEKILGKKQKAEIEDLAFKPNGAPTIAPESDPRPSVMASLSDFDDAVDKL